MLQNVVLAQVGVPIRSMSGKCNACVLLGHTDHLAPRSPHRDLDATRTELGARIITVLCREYFRMSLLGSTIHFAYSGIDSGQAQKEHSDADRDRALGAD